VVLSYWKSAFKHHWRAFSTFAKLEPCWTKKAAWNPKIRDFK